MFPSVSSAEEAAKRAKDAAKDAAKKLFGGPKKFAGSGNKLGGGDGHVPANHPAARRANEATASPPQKALARATPAAAANPPRQLGFQDSTPPPASSSAPSSSAPAVPDAEPQEPAVQVTDSMSEAAALIVSSGPEGLKAAKTVCSVVSNVLKAPKEAKYRQLNCDNPRVAATLAVPGVHEIFRELGFQHLQEAATSSAPPDPGMLNLPLRLPGAKEPLFHGVLSLLRPAIAENTTSATSAAAAPTSTPPAVPDSSGASAAQPPVDTPMAEADDVTPPTTGTTAAPDAVPAMDWGDGPSSSTASPDAAPAMDWGDRPSSSTAAPVSTDAAAGRPGPSAQSEGLGMSAAAWKAENKNNPKKAIMIGNVAVPVGQPEKSQPVESPSKAGGPSAAAAAAAAAAPPENEDDEFTGRNTKVLLPTAPDSEIPDAFFQRTGPDLKAEWQRVKKQREVDQTLMTKAHREKLKMAGRKVHKYATVRVRFPEGIVLQGCFLPNALAFEVHAWVTEHLRALEPFELSSPVLPSKDRKLGHGGTVREAGLMPTCALNFRWTPGGEPVRGPCLSDAALQTAQMDV